MRALSQQFEPLRSFKQLYNVTVVFTYANGRKATESLTDWGQTYTVSTAYDADGRVSQLTYPDGTVVGRTYNNRGLLSTLTYAGGTIDTRTYDNGGRLTSETLGNGLTVTTGYITGENLPASIANAAVGTYGYTWDANHNKTAETITGAMSGKGFTVPGGGYDAEDRLTAWNRSDSALNQSWSLSLVGDWTTLTENGTPTSRTYGPAHELQTVGATTIATELRGNLTRDDTGRTYNWDRDNRLGWTTKGTVTITHYYDAFGRRVMRNDGSARTVYVSDGPTVVAEYANGGLPSAPLRNYVNGSYVDEPVLLVDRTSAGSVGAGSDEKLYYHRNQQYSITALTDNSGTVVERYAYTAYGTPTMFDGAGTTVRTASSYGNTYLFTGRTYDPAAGIYDFRARPYQAQLARFLSRDPAGYIDGASLYSDYFGLSGLDPSGMDYITQDVLPDGTIAIYYVDEGLFWMDGPPIFIGILDPATGLVNRNGISIPIADVNGEVYGDGTTDDWGDWFGRHKEIPGPGGGLVNDALGGPTGGTPLDPGLMAGSQPGGVYNLGSQYEALPVAMGVVTIAPVIVGMQPAPRDTPGPRTKNDSAWFKSERDARNFARNKLGPGARFVGPNKMRSKDGRWQYRAKPDDVKDCHVHLERVFKRQFASPAVVTSG